MRYINNIMVKTGCIILVTLAALAFGQDTPVKDSTAVQPDAAVLPEGQTEPPVQQADVSSDTVAVQSDSSELPEGQAVPPVQLADVPSDTAAVQPDSTELPKGQTEPPVQLADVPSEPSERPERSTRLGVMFLETLTGHDKLAEEMTGVLVAKLDSLGLYDVYRPQDIDRALADARIRKPNNCRDPQCVQSVAKALGLRRMIFGAVDMNGSKCGVTLTLIDVSISRPIESVSIEGAAGVPAKHVVIGALNRLHGYQSDVEVSNYYGPSVNGMNEFMWSTVGVQGAGLFYSVINYGAGGSSGANDIEYVGHGNERLAGVSGSSNQVPVFARPAALANAYTAVSDDAYGALYNPAGMPWAEHREGAFGYQSRFGLDIVALSYVNKASRDIGFGQALSLVTDRGGLMTEMFFTTAAGYKYNDMPIMGPLSLGASLKFIGNTVHAKSLDSPHGQSFGAGLDLGLMWELSEMIRYGLHMKDALALGRWKNCATGSQYNEWIPASLHMGGSYRAGYSTFLVADGQIPVYSDQPWVMSGGLEYEFFRMFALRVGLQREIMDEEADWWKITGGCGIKFDIEPLWGKYLNLDMAYEYNTLELFPVVNVSVRVGF